MEESDALEIIGNELKRYRRHMAGILDEATLKDDEALASLLEDEQKSLAPQKPSSRLQAALKVMRSKEKFKKKEKKK